ncbi:MAG: tyrosine-type recombinase/integrase [Erysipelotrichaceae bacterium]|nr:tyrosine-type recombinase/integrase [Erysipelotrichaceae bacterium]
MTKEIRSFQNYLLSSKNLSNKTILAYSNDIIQFEKYLLNCQKTLLTATNDDIYIFLNDKNLKSKSYNRKITSIIEFYKYLSMINVDFKIEINRLHHIKNDKVYPRIIKIEDIKNMIAVCDQSLIGQRNKVIIMMLYISGIRVSELCNLTYNEVNLDEGFIRLIGKGNKEKIIPVGDILKIVLSNYTNNIRPLILNGLKSLYVFVNSEGEILTRQTVYNIIKQSACKANIKLKVTPHTLRHCFATHMLENGADIRSVQELLGHSDISTTQIYLNIANQQIKNNYFNKFSDPLDDKEELKDEI